MYEAFMYYKGIKKRISYALLKTFEIESEGSLLRQNYIQYSSNKLLDDLEELFHKQLSGQEWSEVWYYFSHQVNHRKKKRWAKKAFTDLERQKAKKPKELYRVLIEFKKLYPDSFEEKVSQHKEAIRTWESNPDSLLQEYPYFHEKTNHAKNVSLKDDLALSFLKYLQTQWEHAQKKTQKAIKEYPYDNQLPYANSITRKPLEFEGTVTVGGEEKQYKDYGPKEGTLRILLENNQVADDLANEFNIGTEVYGLDQIDRDVLSAVLEYRGNNFATDKTIEVKLRSLVKDVFDSVGSKNFNSMLRRLYKLSRLRFTNVTYQEIQGVLTDEVEMTEYMGFFDYVRFRETEKGEIYLAIEINQGIHSRFINNQTLRIYRDQVAMLDSKYHSMLLYMQKERIKAHRAGTTTTELSMTNFLTNIRFRHSSKKKVREEINESLDEVIRAGVLVKNYSNGRENYFIEFTPIDEQEVRDIIGEKKDRIDIQQLLSKKG